MGREQAGPHHEGSRDQHIERSTGVQVGSDNVQINKFYGNRARAGEDHAPSADSEASSGAQSRIPFGEWDPFVLGVHRAIAVQAPEAGQLTRYIRRAFDDELDLLLQQVGTRPLMITLVGESSTGKTRAAYEAASARLADWPMARPETSRDLVRLISSAGQAALDSRLVIWLNEAQTFLRGAAGEEAAGALRRLLAGKAPVVVLGTMWNTHWAELSYTPRGSEPDLQPQTRQLLDSVDYTRIAVPGRFTGEDLRRARQLAENDARLSEALAASADTGEITQTLAGGVWLLNFYHHGLAPQSKSVTTAAIDVRRVGYSTPLSEPLLEQAAEGYMDPYQRVAPAGWFHRALEPCQERLRDAVALLTPVRTAPHVGPSDGYEVADYILQRVGAARRHIPVSALVWPAVLAHATDPDDLARVAVQAGWRSLFETSVRLATGPAERGHLGAMQTLGWVLGKAGFLEESVGWLRRLADSPASPWDAKRLVADPLTKLGRYEEAETALLNADADWWSWVELSSLYALMRRWDDSIKYFGWAWTESMHQVRDELLNTIIRGELVDDAIDAWREHPDGLARMLFRDLMLVKGEFGELVSYWQAQPESGSPRGQARIASLLSMAGRSQDAALWARRSAEGNDSHAMVQLGVILVDSGDITEARQWALKALATGTAATGPLISLLIRCGELRPAMQFIESKNSVLWGLPINSVIVQPLAETGQLDVALRDWDGRIAADTALGRAYAGILIELGRAAEAIGALRGAAERGDIQTIKVLADLHRIAGHCEEAESIWRTLVEIGESDALPNLCHVINAERGDEAKQLWHYGIQPGGRTAGPWEPLSGFDRSE